MCNRDDLLQGIEQVQNHLSTLLLCYENQLAQQALALGQTVRLKDPDKRLLYRIHAVEVQPSQPPTLPTVCYQLALASDPSKVVFHRRFTAAQLEVLP
jgi:purine nucleoside permease